MLIGNVPDIILLLYEGSPSRNAVTIDEYKYRNAQEPLQGIIHTNPG